ncbi:F-box only protein 8-like [Heracleum sosnowskyi]|uniref:F-box only protein 8-like n=1 Tax=Heracleum sosnowskyi TaxID=360622 RepID=A0AAD8JGS6_9APIA|nr:F-box only protein 8-like [Heracleum sosnowskyi]
MALSLQRYTYADKNGSLTQYLQQRIKNEREKSMLIALEKIDCYLPENLIFEILSRLSVKDLLQFKSVCKSWYDIISSPIFVSKHLNNYYNNNDNWRGCLLAQFYATPNELQLYELLVDETPQVLDYEILYDMPLYCSYVCGPCDGLYYVNQYYSDGRALWNPAINEFKTLPEIIPKPDLPDGFTDAYYEVYSLGCDHVSGDYKVVIMKSYQNDIDLKHPVSVVSVLVYSLRTDSWRYCGDLAKAYDLKKNKCYIYVNGCCYWFGSFKDSSEVIVSFDMSNDSFKEIDVPEYAHPSSNCLAVYDDSLVFLSLRKTHKIFDIWTWGVERCWTKKFSVGPLPHATPCLHLWQSRMHRQILTIAHQGNEHQAPWRIPFHDVL